MKTENSTPDEKKITTIEQLISRLSEFPNDTTVDSFVMVFVDKRGYTCKMEYKSTN